MLSTLAIIALAAFKIAVGGLVVLVLIMLPTAAIYHTTQMTQPGQPEPKPGHCW